MKKVTILTAVILVAAVGTYVVMAQQNDGGMMRGGGMGGMMRGGMQGRNMMSSDNMGPMNGCSLVATEDGGVVVMMGNELMKYDKDLNLTKKAEIKFDWENWQKMMSKRRDMMMGQSENK